MDSLDIQSILQSSNFQAFWADYDFLKIEDLMALVNTGKLQQLPKNQHFIQAGDFSKKVGFILEGLIRFYHLKDGEEYNLVFKHEFQMASSFECIVLKQATSYSYEALEDTLLLVFDYDQMEELFAQNQRLERFGRYFIQQELAMAVKVFEKHLFYSPEERYLKFLEEYPHLMNRVPLKHLASFMGVTPVSLSRIRKRVADNKV
jgi:CRP/FNR family transcriptional regulator, anaerobic regulatory protein